MKKVCLGIIGCGGISRYHGQLFVNHVPEAEIVALADPNEGNRQQFQRAVLDAVHARPPQFADYRDMLRTVPLDAVLIATPHTLHFQQTLEALAAGCHVLLEKPMVTDSQQARQLVAEAQRHKRVLSIAFPGPHSPEFAYYLQLRDRGEVGKVLLMNGFVTQSWLAITRNTWRQDPSLSGGGQAYDTGAHLFMALMYLSGAKPREVFAWTDNRGAPVDINTVATIRFDNGALASVCVGGDGPVKWENSVWIVAERGGFRMGIHGGFLEHWDAKGDRVRYPHVPQVPSLQQHFIDCVLGRTETLCPPIWGLRQALLMDALYESARTGRVAQVAPE